MEVHGQQQSSEKGEEDVVRAGQTEEQQQQQQQQTATLPLSIENTERPRQATVYLSEATVRLHRRDAWQGQPRHEVPPVTPNSEFQFENTFQPLPQTFHDLLQDLQIPIVKNKGVKRCIEELGQYFRCTDYEFNFLHFWFLDVITDCLQRTQNRFHLPAREQKIVLAWLFFAIDIIRDISKNLSRNEFIKTAQETLFGAAKMLQEGIEILPLRLVRILGSEIPDNEYSNVTSETSKTSDSVFGKLSDIIFSGEDTVEAEMNEEYQINEDLNRRSATFGSCTCSALDVVYEDWIKTAEDMSENDFLYNNIYLPQNKIEPRFVSLSAIQELNSDVDIEDIFLKDIGETSQLMFLEIGKLDFMPGSDKYYVIFRKEIQENSDEDVICEKDQTSTDDKQKDETMDASKMDDNAIENTKTERGRKIMDLRRYQLLEQRIKNITDCDVYSDWQMEDLWKTINDNNGEEEDECLDGGERFDESPDSAEDYNGEEYIRFKVLWTIIDLISDYKLFGLNEYLIFSKIETVAAKQWPRYLWITSELVGIRVKIYIQVVEGIEKSSQSPNGYVLSFSDNFQYLLIKMAMTAPPNLIIQKLNNEWPVPKQLKEDVTAYVKDLKDKYKQIPVKVKKEKMPKEKKVKDVKSTKETGLDESESKDVKDKKSKEVKEKKKPPTEEELLLKKQLEELEAERQRQEMNKKFIFPLQEAVDDEFFKNNFPNWKKINWRKGKPKTKPDLDEDDDD